MELNLLDRMLEQYQTGQTPVTVTLQNQIRVHGTIKAFDSYVIILEGQRREILYRHAVSSLAPSPQQETRKPPRQKPAQERPATRPPKRTQKKKPAQQAPTMAAAGSDQQGINSSMRDGLLKWMQDQKAAK